MAIDLPPPALEHVIDDVSHVANDLAAATVGRPPLLDVVNDLAAPCDPET